MRKLTIFGVIVAMTVVFVLGLAALPPASLRVAEANPGTQWNASYFNNKDLSGGAVLTRIDDQINFNWGAGSPDASKVHVDQFSARWTKTVNFPNSGKWTFRVGADDGIRMWIDVTQIVNEWHGNPEGYRTYEVSLDGLTAGNHDLKVEYFEDTGNAGVKVEWWFGGGSGGGGAPGTVYGAANWNGSYFNNKDLSGSPVLTRTDGDINFDWGAGSPDASKVPADNFSVRWTTTFNFPATGRWHFQVGADDGIRMWIDVTQIVNEWHGNPEGFKVYDINVDALTAGNHDLKVEYYDATGNARVSVRWWQGDAAGATTTATPMPTATPIPPTVVYAAVIGTEVNVRSGPGEGNPVIGQLTYAKNYLVLGAVPDMSWVKIDLGGGTTGWVSNEWVWLYSTDDKKNKDTTEGGQPDFVDTIPRINIAIAPPAPGSEHPPAKVLPGQTTDVVNVRDGASIYNAVVIGSLPQGVNVEVHARSANWAWYLISYQGVRGWVNASYVTLNAGTPNDLVVSTEAVPQPPAGSVFVPVSTLGVPAVTVRGRAVSNLYQRDAASLNGKQIGSVPAGAEFVIEGRNSNGAWYLLTYNGVQGWINAGYVTLIEGTVSDLPIR